MEEDSLAATLRRLNRCQDAAELIYSKDAARTLAQSNASNNSNTSDGGVVAKQEDFSLTVARRIGTMVARLNDLASPSSQVVLTPRMVLYELMDILRHALYASLPVNMQTEASATDKAAEVRQFSVYASARKVPLEAAVEGLYVVSYVSVKLRVELVALQLRRRLQEELKKKDTETSEASVAALVVTGTLLDDLMTVYKNIVLTLPITKTATSTTSSSSSSSGGSEVALAAGAASDVLSGAASATQRLAPVFLQYYYQLCDWVLVLESTMQGPATAYTQVRRLTVDEHRGTAEVELHRPTPDTPWGLLINEQGCLVDIDVSLRVFDRARRLHQLLQVTPQGAHITKINDKAIPALRHNEQKGSGGSGGAADYAAYAQRVVAELQAATAQRKTLRLTLQSTAFKAAAQTMPTEVAFVAPPQGGEGTSGQRVTLVLRRQSTAVEWGFAVDERLYWHPPSLRVLSDAAKDFVKVYGRHLRLLAINGVEALHTTQVELLMASAETVVLELLVMPSFSSHKHKGTAAAAATAVGGKKSRDGAAHLAGNKEAQMEKKVGAVNTKKGEAVKESPKAAKLSVRSFQDSTDPAAARFEAAVSEMLRARLDESTAAGTDGARTGEGTATVALETPLVDAVAVTPSAAAAAAAAAVAAGLEGKRKRGRPHKTAATAPAEAVAETDESEKKRRGRPRSTAAAPGEAAATTAAVESKAEATSAVAATTTTPAAVKTPLEADDAAVQAILKAFEDKDDGKKSVKKAAVPATDGESQGPVCVFDNKVSLLRLSSDEMVLERPSTDMPWGLPIGRIADTSTAPQQLPLRLMSLPPAKAAAVRKHPFLTQFKKEPSTWFIAEVNGKSAANAEATLKTIGKLTRMTLRFLRK